jgi:hypothetical protein
MLTIALIGCSKTKANPEPGGYLEARALYDSDLFRKRVAHVEKRNLPWYILSAKSGLLKPTVAIRPYNMVLTELTPIEVAEWHVGVANQILSELWYGFDSPKLSDVTIEIHAGAKYCDPLGSILGLLGMKVSKPMEHTSIGKQLAFYKSA